jgi:hypothetical protein
MSVEKDYEKLVVKIAARIRAHRLRCGYSQTDMERFGFDVKNYQKIEYGKSCSLYTLMRLSRAFRCSIQDIVNEDS